MITRRCDCLHMWQATYLGTPSNVLSSQPFKLSERDLQFTRFHVYKVKVTCGINCAIKYAAKALSRFWVQHHAATLISWVLRHWVTTQREMDAFEFKSTGVFSWLCGWQSSTLSSPYVQSSQSGRGVIQGDPLLSLPSPMPKPSTPWEKQYP